jgi:uncharacterized protein with ParB-like and HNH nuclease domain
VLKKEKTMDTQLHTLSKIFTERLFRIPDYQRGYAWTEKQLRDFWNDIQQLEAGHNHYTGVLTLENVPEHVSRQWEDDHWIVDAKSYQPFFVVDGQQRLTTAIVLIQVILERLLPSDKLNFTERIDIQRKFIFDSRDGGISRSYIFGYEKDNPSYEYLKTKVFCEKSSTAHLQETVYTQNLARAKEFFTELVASLGFPELETLYRKVTQQLLFNIFTITEDVDVCVAFETMNNRGKPLSYLELLKNRLIYLSLKFEDLDYERAKLRRAINDCWKAIYHNLGRNKEQPLDDDRFLMTHYIIYFGKTINDENATDEPMRFRRLYRADYASDLLERRFVPKNVATTAPAEDKITVKSVYTYVSSLQVAVETWYKMWNPIGSDLDRDTQMWLDKLNRLGMAQFQPLVLVFLQNVDQESKRVSFLQAIERHLFVMSLIDRLYDPYPLELDPRSLQLAVDLNTKMKSAEKTTKAIAEATASLLKRKEFLRNVISKFRHEGFYEWGGIRYFLFEYNLDLQARSKTNRPKIFWPEFSERKEDFVSVEHIFPQQARHAYWNKHFNDFSLKQRTTFCNSLGNLLPLSKPKNSSLSNKPFPDKVDGKSDPAIGYRYGCYAENEVAKCTDWTPAEILNRGVKLLEFMEKRWGMEIGDDEQKRTMLGLDFVK